MTDGRMDPAATDGLSVAPDGNEGAGDEGGAPNAGNNAGRDPRQDAGQDRSIEKRLQKNPTSEQAQLDNALDETMDGSDPVGIIQPKHSSEPPASSGYDPEAERRLQEGE